MDKVLDFSLLGKKMKHGNALSKNIDCFWYAIDMQIREAKVQTIFKLIGNLDTVCYERPVYFQFSFLGYETSRMACNSTGY